MTQAIICVQGDSSVGLPHQWYYVNDLEFDDVEHRKDAALALRECFARISGNHINDVAVRFDDDFAWKDQPPAKDWKVQGLTDTYLNEQRN